MGEGKRKKDKPLCCRLRTREFSGLSFSVPPLQLFVSVTKFGGQGPLLASKNVKYLDLDLQLEKHQTMGNVTTQDLKDGANADEDSEFMMLKASVLFNPVYLQQKHSKIAKFAGTDPKEKQQQKKKVDGAVVEEKMEGKGREKQMMNLFASKIVTNRLLTVDGSSQLATTDKPAELEDHENALMMRLRLFLRIHLAYVRLGLKCKSLDTGMRHNIPF